MITQKLLLYTIFALILDVQCVNAEQMCASISLKFISRDQAVVNIDGGTVWKVEGPNSQFPMFRASADDTNPNCYCFNTNVLSKSGGARLPPSKMWGGLGPPGLHCSSIYGGEGGSAQLLYAKAGIQNS